MIDAGTALSVIEQYLGPDAGLDRASIARVPGETDANFVFATGTSRYVLKVSFAADLQTIARQQCVLQFLEATAPECAVPRVVRTASGHDHLVMKIAGVDVIVRILTWLRGRPLGTEPDPSPELLDDIGAAAGAIADALARFEPAAEVHRPVPGQYWDLDAGCDVVAVHRERLPGLADMLTAVLDRVVPALAAAAPLPVSLVHNDLNVFNVLVSTTGARTRVSGVIDFGDMIVTSRVNDLAILISSVCRSGDRLVEKAARVTAAYHARCALTESEIDVVFPLVLLRTTTVLVTTADSEGADPRHRNSVSATHVRDLAEYDPRIVAAHLRQACGLPRMRETDAALQWLAQHRNRLHPIVTGPTQVLDRSAHGQCYDGIDPLDRERLREASARLHTVEADGKVGIGRHREPDFALGGPRNRAHGRRDIRLALQIDGAAGIPVVAPLAGEIRAGADGDVVLDHRPAGAPLWTRYNGLTDIASGTVEAGGMVGRIAEGTSVLAQLVTVDPTSVAVPWWCSGVEAHVLTQFAPDASALLGSTTTVRAWEPRLTRSLASRARHLPRTHPTYFDEPIDMVRAGGCWFYDESGNRYLDALNNVTLLGHCHPRLTAVAQRQLGRLQTNSRFVYDALTDYTDALVGTLPDGLDVVYMLNSGSEANDLALRMARHVTGREDIVVIEDAYHGYTTAVSDVSPSRYKHYGKPATTHPVPNPDRYRGAYGYDDPDAGPKYAADVIAEFDRLIAEGRPPAAFIYEALLAGGGQVVLPPNYLAPIHVAARERGILTIADEVQVGFGRLGSAFWGFQTQGPAVVPDFVTMGKSMGNGFPVSALVTTRAHSRRFDETGRFFSTYGGNPAACVVAHETLSVLADEGLQQNAQTTGEYLRTKLRALMDRHSLIGDVRGQGFYSGVEFVLDRSTKEHAVDETLIVCNRMKDAGVLVYPTGPQWNILKIKPPLSFTRDHADLFAGTLDHVLNRGW
ncbi:aminotransferase class III-fold pyridoxal phosphate-dependent enzyme [Rhodococcus sp. NPDC057014]|uniref:aminotransferase class III-fold pyridoxal phosphate-dependent enzyme n=1 Tax=Rhodococcus sp. NPDC057014 TaxID=3346000 RepID=UPI00362DF550